jgi:hypothetical protein
LHSVSKPNKKDASVAISETRARFVWNRLIGRALKRSELVAVRHFYFGFGGDFSPVRCAKLGPLFPDLGGCFTSSALRYLANLANLLTNLRTFFSFVDDLIARPLSYDRKKKYYFLQPLQLTFLLC